MVIAVYLPSCLSQLSSGSVAKIWQSVSVHAERGSKLDGNYGLGFLGCHPKKHWIRWFESENGNGACHGRSRSLSASLVVNSPFTPPFLHDTFLADKHLFFFFNLPARLSFFLADLRCATQNLCNERSVFTSKTWRQGPQIRHGAWCLFIYQSLPSDIHSEMKTNTQSWKNKCLWSSIS